MWIILIFFLSYGIERDNIKEYAQVDLIELNHVQRTDGSHAYSQYIFWKEFPHKDSYKLKALGYVMVNSIHDGNCLLTKRPNYYEFRNIVKDKKKIHIITAPIFKESWTNNDPERDSINLDWKGQTIPSLFVDKAAIEAEKLLRESDEK